jgi:hypothetical protein
MTHGRLKMGEKLIEQGSFISGRCSVCKDGTRHVVLSVKDGKAERVQCVSCNDAHNYKAPPPSKLEKQRLTTDRLRSKKLAEDCATWAELRPTMIEAKAKDYAMDGLFKKKDLINHPVFGLGLVQSRAGSHKVEVLFEDGCKVMRCQ